MMLQLSEVVCTELMSPIDAKDVALNIKIQNCASDREDSDLPINIPCFIDKLELNFSVAQQL